MNKKLLSVLLALSMMTRTAALADGYTAGTYMGRADGRNGEITVDVTFSEDAITDIVVKDHQETAGIADADALRAVPVEKELSTETIEMTTDVVVVGGVMGDDSPSGANNGWALTAGKLAAEAIAE